MRVLIFGMRLRLGSLPLLGCGFGLRYAGLRPLGRRARLRLGSGSLRSGARLRLGALRSWTRLMLLWCRTGRHVVGLGSGPYRLIGMRQLRTRRRSIRRRRTAFRTVGGVIVGSWNSLVARGGAGRRSRTIRHVAVGDVGTAGLQRRAGVLLRCVLRLGRYRVCFGTPLWLRARGMLIRTALRLCLSGA